MRHGVLHGIAICLTILALALIAGCGSGSGGATSTDGGEDMAAAATMTGAPAELLPNADELWSGKVPVDAGAGSLEGIYLRQTPDASGKFDANIYLVSSSNQVVALNRNGMPKWVFKRMELPPEFPPVEGPGAVAFITRNKLWVVHRETGSLLLSRSLPFTPSAPPALSASAVYIPSLADNRIYSLSIADGGLGWRIRLSSPITAAPTIAGSVGRPSLHVATQKGGVFAFDALSATAPPTSEPRWQKKLPDGVVADLTTSIDRTLVYVPCEDFALHAFRASTGEEAWSYNAGRPLKVSALEVGEIVFVKSEGKVIALNAADGAVKWTLEGIQRPICQWGKDYLLRNTDGKVLRVMADSGEVLAAETLPDGMPTEFVVTDPMGGRCITADRDWNLSVLVRRKY